MVELPQKQKTETVPGIEEVTKELVATKELFHSQQEEEVAVVEEKAEDTVPPFIEEVSKKLLGSESNY